MTLRVGLAGYGYWGPNHARVFEEVSGAGLSAIADPSELRLREAARRFPRTRMFSDASAMIASDEIDALVIASPPEMHEDMALEALRRGVHVLIEKPFASSVEGCYRIADASRAAGRVAMAGHTFIYNAAVQWLVRAVRAGELGDVYYAVARRLNLGKVRSDVNALWNFGPHDVSIVLEVFDEFPTSVNARGFGFLQPHVEDVVFLTLEFPSGRAAHIHISWLDPLKKREMTVVGSQRMVLYDDVSSDAKITVYDRSFTRTPREAPPFDSFAEFQLIKHSGDVWIPAIPFQEPLAVQAAHFVQCCRAGTEPTTDAASAARVIAVLEAADKSLANRGQTVPVEEPRAH